MKKHYAIIIAVLLLCGCAKQSETDFFELTEQFTGLTEQETSVKEEKVILPDYCKTVAEDFCYGDIPSEIEGKIKGKSYPEGEAKIALNDLSYVKLLHYDFEGNIKEGEMVVHKSLAKEVTEIFYELYKNKYPIHSIRLIDDFNADDAFSMENNNTSCFNYRVVDNTETLSMHAYGAAIDINPLLNPYVTKNGVSPKGSEEYADRKRDFKGKIDKEDLAYKLFKERGWTWGGEWKTVKDYQHFQKKI